MASKRKALFLDRDGTVNIEKDYLYRIEDFEWVPGILDLCRAAVARGYALIIVTNQSGIARGYYTEADYAKLTAWLRQAFAEAGAPLTDVLHCPLLESPDRKPAPGLFLRARDTWDIDMAGSLSLGDKPRDVQAGLNAGVGRNYLLDAAATDCPGAAGIVSSPAALIPLLD